MIGFIIGLLVGVMLGVFVMCLFSANHIGEKHHEDDISRSDVEHLLWSIYHGHMDIFDAIDYVERR